MTGFTQTRAWLQNLQHNLNQVTTGSPGLPHDGISDQHSSVIVAPCEHSSAVPPEALTRVADEALMTILAQGDTEALGVLYDRSSDLVFSLAAHIAGDRACAEDVTQDLFQHVWTSTPTLPASRRTVHGFIVALTQHHAIKGLRKHHPMPTSAMSGGARNGPDR